jgi:hypothetical protein
MNTAPGAAFTLESSLKNVIQIVAWPKDELCPICIASPVVRQGRQLRVALAIPAPASSSSNAGEKNSVWRLRNEPSLIL